MKDNKENKEQKSKPSLPPSPTSPAATQSDAPKAPPVPDSPEPKKTEETGKHYPDVPVFTKKESTPEQDLDLLKNKLPEVSPGLQNELETLLESNEGEKEEEVKILDSALFAKPIDPSERAHYQKILKSNRDTIGSLRKQLQDSLATIEALNKTKE